MNKKAKASVVTGKQKAGYDRNNNTDMINNLIEDEDSAKEEEEEEENTGYKGREEEAAFDFMWDRTAAHIEVAIKLTIGPELGIRNLLENKKKGWRMLLTNGFRDNLACLKESRQNVFLFRKNLFVWKARCRKPVKSYKADYR